MTAPKAVTLTFNEGVEASLGAIRVFDSRGQRLEVGTPIHPGGNSKEVRSSLPTLARRDLRRHVACHLRRLAPRARRVHVCRRCRICVGEGNGEPHLPLADGPGRQRAGRNRVRGARFGVFLGLAVLIGASAFLAFVWPSGRTTARARRVVWIAWLVAFVATVVGFVLQGPYAAGLSITDAFKPSIWSDVWNTRFGHIWIAPCGAPAARAPADGTAASRSRSGGRAPATEVVALGRRGARTRAQCDSRPRRRTQRRGR